MVESGNGEWGVGNGEWGMGNGEWGMGNGEWGVGNGEAASFVWLCKFLLQKLITNYELRITN